jgi:hypothetical protein
MWKRRLKVIHLERLAVYQGAAWDEEGAAGAVGE